jgi:hypothetical protein
MQVLTYQEGISSWELVLHPHMCIISVALSPQANYADWSTTTCWRSLVPTLVDRGVSRGQRGGSPTVVNLSFLDWHVHNMIPKWYCILNELCKNFGLNSDSDHLESIFFSNLHTLGSIIIPLKLSPRTDQNIKHLETIVQ